MNLRLHIYCDFDGTISEQDMIGVIARRFVPEAGRVIVAEVNALRMTVREGVERLFAHIPSGQLPEVQAYALDHLRIREGFPEFAALCADRGWPLTVVSGGFDFFVEPALAELPHPPRIVCNRVDTSGSNLVVKWGVTCDEHCDGGCGLCKPTVIRRENHGDADLVVVIGDGVTDLKAARQADVVFARDRLRDACVNEGISFRPFETFTEIGRALVQLAEEGNVQ